MYLIFLDTETTGINPDKHRILEIALKVVDATRRHVLLGYESVISQTQEVWGAADPESLAFNGFTWEQTLHGKTEKVVASEIANDLNRILLGQNEAVFICQNPSFDRTFFLQLINADVQESYGWPYHWLDLASMYWAICHLGNAHTLIKESDLSKDMIAAFYGLPAEGTPHRAMNGVNHLIACYEAIFGFSIT